MRIRNVLFAASHCDDEVACAGTLFMLKKSGAVVHVVTFSYSRPEGGDDIGRVHAEWEKSMATIGVDRATVFDWGCDKLATRAEEIRQFLYEYVRKNEIDTGFVLSKDDPHQSHSTVGAEAERVMRDVPRVLRCFFPWDQNIGNASVYSILTKEALNAKVAAISAYESQKFRYKYADLFRHQAIADGLAVKREAAERFALVRAII